MGEVKTRMAVELVGGFYWYGDPGFSFPRFMRDRLARWWLITLHSNGSDVETGKEGGRGGTRGKGEER